MLDFSDHTRTGISILTSAADIVFGRIKKIPNLLFFPLGGNKHLQL